jgi:hypothetical protein
MSPLSFLDALTRPASAFRRTAPRHCIMPSRPRGSPHPRQLYFPTHLIEGSPGRRCQTEAAKACNHFCSTPSTAMTRKLACLLPTSATAVLLYRLQPAVRPR